jgi:hypothetical protein
MTNEELYNEIKSFRKEYRADVKDINNAVKVKANKTDVDKSQAIIYKVLFSLFGVNMFGILALIITVVKAI